MQQWEPFTVGFARGTPYGLGLFRQPLRLPLKSRRCPAAAAAVCKCSPLTGCILEATSIGHQGLGGPEASSNPTAEQNVADPPRRIGYTAAAMHGRADYGSGFPIIGFIKELNVSFALGSNTGEQTMGMNYSLGTLENDKFTGSLYCPLLQAAVQAELPGFPDFACAPIKQIASDAVVETES